MTSLRARGRGLDDVVVDVLVGVVIVGIGVVKVVVVLEAVEVELSERAAGGGRIVLGVVDGRGLTGEVAAMMGSANE